jgi:hypothetical protein
MSHSQGSPETPDIPDTPHTHGQPVAGEPVGSGAPTASAPPGEPGVSSPTTTAGARTAGTTTAGTTSAGTTAADGSALGGRPAHSARSTGPLRLLAILVIIGGVILSVAGAITWVVVTNQLSDEKIVVADDADRFAGEKVNGPFTAFAQADVINKHALEDTDGQTYAQLDQDDPRRDTVMTASFLRASLFTSVVAFGVAAFAFGLGLLLIVVGLALMRVDRSLRTVD